MENAYHRAQSKGSYDLRLLSLIYPAIAVIMETANIDVIEGLYPAGLVGSIGADVGSGADADDETSMVISLEISLIAAVFATALTTYFPFELAVKLDEKRP